MRIVSALTASAAAILLLACSPPNKQPPTPAQTTVTKFHLKDFITGVPVSPALKAASAEKSQWSFLGEPRTVKYETLKDGTVASISFELRGGSSELYDFQDEIEKQYKTKDGQSLRFRCDTVYDSQTLLDTRFSVGKNTCTVSDGEQVLTIFNQYNRYEEPLVKQNPGLYFILNTGRISLENTALAKKKAEEIAQAKAADDRAQMEKFQKERALRLKDM